MPDAEDANDAEDTESARAAGAALRHFQDRFRRRQPTPEEEAAMDLAVELGNVETQGLADELAAGTAGSDLPTDLRHQMIVETATVLELSQYLADAWGEGDIGDVLSSARGLRDAVGALIPTIQKAWPNKPPPDPADY